MNDIIAQCIDQVRKSWILTSYHQKWLEIHMFCDRNPSCVCSVHHLSDFCEFVSMFIRSGKECHCFVNFLFLPEKHFSKPRGSVPSFVSRCLGTFHLVKSATANGHLLCALFCVTLPRYFSPWIKCYCKRTSISEITSSEDYIIWSKMIKNWRVWYAEFCQI